MGDGRWKGRGRGRQGKRAAGEGVFLRHGGGRGEGMYSGNYILGGGKFKAEIFVGATVHRLKKEEEEEEIWG